MSAGRTEHWPWERADRDGAIGAVARLLMVRKHVDLNARLVRPWSPAAAREFMDVLVAVADGTAALPEGLREAARQYLAEAFAEV